MKIIGMRQVKLPMSILLIKYMEQSMKAVFRVVYSKDEEVLRYEEWSQPEDDIQNGLTVVVKGEWISG